MDWYYSIGGEQKGPVSETDFQQLVQDGIVTGQTLVWRPGMTQWQAYSTTNAATSDTPSDPARQAPPSGVICASCGNSFSSSDVVSLEGRAYCATCKPMVAQRLREGLTMDSAAEETRKAHLNHESSVRSVGILYLFVGTILFLFGVWAAVHGAIRSDVGGISAGVFLLLLGSLQFWTGLALRQLKRWARVPIGIFSAIGLVMIFPLGTIINAYILYVIFSAKRTMVFSEEYQAIIQQTPHIKYRTSIVVWILFAVIIVVLLFAVAGAVLRFFLYP